MKKALSYVLAAGLLLNPFAALAADYGSQSPQTNQAPPVAQPLVREGDFAIKLAAKLDLGLPTNEAIAEEMLAKAGVVPVNGWLSDYPVTPEIVGQLQDAVAKAASDGKLPMTASEATRGLYSLAAEMNLPTPAGTEGAPTGGPAGSTSSPEPATNPAVINNYYYDQGPPVITYYPPPYDYYYLYAWVPYPVFWFGFWFPGFYICHDFTTVVVSHPFYGEVGRRHIVTNRVIDPVTRRVAVVDPVTRTGAGAVRPVTTLRSGSGRTFTTLAELRREPGVAKVNAGRRTVPNNTMGTGGFRSPQARRSAEAIYSRSIQGMRTNAVREGGMMRGDGRRYVSPSTAPRMNASPSWGGERRYSNTVSPAPVRKYRQPEMSRSGESLRRSYPAPISPSTERSYNGPARHFFGGERQFVSPSMPSWSHNSAPLTRGSSGAVRSFPGSGGWHWQGRGR